MATVTSSHSSSLFSTQRTRRPFRSDYGTPNTYSSPSSRPDSSFVTKRYTAGLSNGPSISTDSGSYSSSYTRRRGVSVDRQPYSGAGARRSSLSVDRDIKRSTRTSEMLFGNSSSASTVTSRTRDHSSTRFEPKGDYISSKPRRRYSLSMDRDIGKTTRITPLFPSSTRRNYTDIIDIQAERRQMEKEARVAAEHERKLERDQQVRNIITKATTSDNYAGFDYRTMLDGIPKRHRSSSISYTESEVTKPTSLRSRQEYRSSRGSSVARSYLTDAADDYMSLRPRRRSASVTPLENNTHRHYDVIKADYDVSRAQRQFQDQDYELASSENIKTGYKRDISSLVLDPRKPFRPNDIKATTLPSGKQAVTYTESNEYGNDAYNPEADAELDRVIQKTKSMQQSMHTLENFVRANRTMFPEDTCVYQQIRFFQLSKDQLAAMGEPEDAVLYGVKIRERLVVPHGTDVTDILSRYYGNKDDIDVEYSSKTRMKQAAEEESSQNKKHLEETIRKQVEADFEKRDAARILGNEGFESRQASRQQELYERYKHVHPHLTENYVKSLYVNAGLDYDSIYEISRSQRSNASLVSDLESVYTRSSSAPSAAERRAKQAKLDAAPQFTSALRPKRTSEGCTVRFNCSVTALPMPDVMWMRGNTIIEDGPRHHISNNFGLLSLEINDLKREDAGVYTVKISNKEGEAVCSATLEIQEALKFDDRPDGERKAWFILEAQNQWNEVGQRVTFEAQATGRPMPCFKWLRDNHTLQNDDRVRMYSDEQGNAKLVIKELTHADNGLYFCVAENKAGKTKCAATLKIVDKGQLGDRRRSGSRSRSTTPMRRRSTSRDVTPLAASHAHPRYGSRESTPTGLKEQNKTSGVAPWFLQTLTAQLEVHEGEPIELKCIVDGDPKPRVTWLKEPYRELMYSKRHRVVSAGDHHFMGIKSSIQNDAGRFIVVAENDVGKIQSACWVNMLPPRDIESEDFDVRTSVVQMPEYEYEIETVKEHGKMAPRFIKKLPLQREVKEGDDIEVECKIDEAKTEEIVTDVHIKTKVVKEGAIKTLTIEKSGAIHVEKDVFADRDKTPTPPNEEETEAKEVKAEPPKEQEKKADTAETEEPKQPSPEPVVEPATTPESSKGAESSKTEAEPETKAEVAPTSEVESKKKDVGSKPDEEAPVEEEIAVAKTIPSERPPLTKQAKQSVDDIDLDLALKDTEEVKEVKDREKSPTPIAEEAIQAQQKSSQESAPTEASDAVLKTSKKASKSGNSTFTSKQKLQLLGSSSEDRCDSPPAGGAKIKVKTKAHNSGSPMLISKGNESHVTMTSVTLGDTKRERGSMRRMSSKELFIVCPGDNITNGQDMTVAGISPPKEETEFDSAVAEESVEGTIQVVAGIEPKADEETNEKPDEKTVDETDEAVAETKVETVCEEKSEAETTQTLQIEAESQAVAENEIKAKEQTEAKSASVVEAELSAESQAATESASNVADTQVADKTDARAESEDVAAAEEKSEDKIEAETEGKAVAESENKAAAESVSEDKALAETVSADKAVAETESEDKAVAKSVSEDKAVAETETAVKAAAESEAQSEAVEETMTSEALESCEASFTMSASGAQQAQESSKSESRSDEASSSTTEVIRVTKSRSKSIVKSATSEARSSIDEEVHVIVQADDGASESMSPSCLVRKGESRAESVVSEDPTESSWTEYTSEALSESDVDTEVDDVILVKKRVKRVTKQVVEVDEDGEEKVVSKVTEVTTKVTEDGETKTETTVTTEKKGDAASEGSSSSESSSESSSSDSSDDESSTDSTDSAATIGKGDAVTATAAKDETADKSKAENVEETEAKVAAEVHEQADEAKVSESVQGQEVMVSETTQGQDAKVNGDKAASESESETSDSDSSESSEDSDDDSETSSEEE